METINKELLNNLKSAHGKPCISVFLPTHKTSPENKQDQIRYKNLLKELENKLEKTHSSREVDKLLKPFNELGVQDDFWSHTGKGLALFSAPDYFQSVGIQIPVQEQVVVAENFYTKPLQNYLQTKDRFQVLALSRDSLKLYEGNRHELSEVILHPSVADNIEDALGEELTDEHLTVASYGQDGASDNRMYHGHGGKKDQVGIDTERFFRVVAKDIDQYHSKPSDLPLILAALPEHQPVYRKINTNHLLLKQGIELDPFGVTTDKLASEAWKVIEPNYKKYLEELKSQFEQAQSEGLGSINLKEIAKAMALGQIETLMVAASVKIQGVIDDKTTGSIKTEGKAGSEMKDLSEDIADEVAEKGGEVIIVPDESMPNKAGLAAIYRYKL